MMNARFLLLAALSAGCGVKTHTVTPRDAEPPGLTPSQQGLSSCTSKTLRSFVPSVGSVMSRTSDTAVVEVEDVTHALALRCGDRDAVQCYDDATSLAPVAGERERRVIEHRMHVRGHAVTLEVDGTEFREVYATEAELVAEIRRLESEHDAVHVRSVGRAIDPDWSVVDVQIRGPNLSRSVATTELEWTLPSTSLRRLVESVHVLLDELDDADVVVINQAEVFEALGGRVLASFDETTTQGSDAAMIGAIISNYPAVDDTKVERPFTVVLSTRCRADHED